MSTVDPIDAFIVAACVPLDSGHRDGDLNKANAILSAHPEVAKANIYTAAILGDEPTVRGFFSRDTSSATAKGGPHGWDALTYLCFSKYLRLDPSRSNGLVNTARALIEAGANANTGWFEENHQPKPCWESAIYGAAGIAQHPGVTRVLLEHGADPNDGETPYHVPETDDNTVLRILIDSGKLNQDSLTTLLLRKADWHDPEGQRMLLEAGANPNDQAHWGSSPLHHALRRDNALANIEQMLNFGGDPAQIATRDNKSGLQIAAERGRSDALRLFAARGFSAQLADIDRLIAACATNDDQGIAEIIRSAPETQQALVERGGILLSQFAGNGNIDGVARLLDLGVPVDAPYVSGDGYWGVAPNSTALHVAAWRLRDATVRLLLERGAKVDARDGHGRTALMLAVKGCVDSHWVERRTPETVAALLDAGASVSGVLYPCGYEAVDALLKQHGAATKAAP
jgi:ankyrin repeat protein